MGPLDGPASRSGAAPFQARSTGGQGVQPGTARRGRMAFGDAGARAADAGRPQRAVGFRQARRIRRPDRRHRQPRRQALAELEQRFPGLRCQQYLQVSPAAGGRQLRLPPLLEGVPGPGRGGHPRLGQQPRQWVGGPLPMGRVTPRLFQGRQLRPPSVLLVSGANARKGTGWQWRRPDKTWMTIYHFLNALGCGHLRGTERTYRKPATA